METESKMKTKAVFWIKRFFMKSMVPLLVIYSLGCMAILQGLNTTSVYRKTYRIEAEVSNIDPSHGQLYTNNETNGKRLRQKFEDMKTLRNLYDHPVVKKVEKLNVFYITAIADTSSILSLHHQQHQGNRKNLTSEPIIGMNVDANDGVDDNINVDATQQYLTEENSDLQSRLDKIPDLGRFDRNIVNSEQFIRKYKNMSAYNITHTQGVITINGWDAYSLKNRFFYCCYKYNNSQKRQVVPMVQKNIWNICKIKVFTATQYICPLLKPRWQVSPHMKPPTEVSLSVDKNCRDKHLQFIDVEEAAPKHSGSIAICAKVMYNTYPPERLIEWFEFNILMGVDKILMFTHNVANDTKAVLHYYEKTGLLTMKEFDYPMKLRYPRKLGEKMVLLFHDEQVTVFDCVERFQGYGYIAIIDIDEFLVPSNAISGTWKTMLKQMLSKNPKASGFAFHTKIFTLDWGISNKHGDFFVTKYIKRTRTMWDRRKNIIIPARLVRGSAWTHSFVSAAGYHPVKIPSDTASMFHYRKCRRHWIKYNTCQTNRSKYKDSTMVTVMQRIKDRVNDMKHKLLNKLIETSDVRIN